MILELIMTILILVANWMIFKKMGHQGWEGIIPVYNLYVLCADLYGNGWKFLLLLIPLYNIYFAIKMYIDLAHAFHMSTGFGWGLALLPFIFGLILGFGDAQYGDGSKANTSSDFISDAVSKTMGAASAPRRDDQALEKIAQLNELWERGVISEEEYNAKKDDLLKRI